jgi:hypothetical protein
MPLDIKQVEESVRKSSYFFSPPLSGDQDKKDHDTDTLLQRMAKEKGFVIRNASEEIQKRGYQFVVMVSYFDAVRDRIDWDTVTNKRCFSKIPFSFKITNGSEGEKVQIKGRLVDPPLQRKLGKDHLVFSSVDEFLSYFTKDYLDLVGLKPLTREEREIKLIPASSSSMASSSTLASMVIASSSAAVGVSSVSSIPTTSSTFSSSSSSAAPSAPIPSSFSSSTLLNSALLTSSPVIEVEVESKISSEVKAALEQVKDRIGAYGIGDAFQLASAKIGGFMGEGQSVKALQLRKEWCNYVALDSKLSQFEKRAEYETTYDNQINKPKYYGSSFGI